MARLFLLFFFAIPVFGANWHERLTAVLAPHCGQFLDQNVSRDGKYLAEWVDFRAAGLGVSRREFVAALEAVETPGATAPPWASPELGLLELLITQTRFGGGTKPYQTSLNKGWMDPEFFVAWESWIDTVARRSGPTWLRFVGLGNVPGELRFVLTLLDDSMEKRVGKDAQAKRELAETWGLRFGLYDINPGPLAGAERTARELQTSYPWARGRISFHFANLLDGRWFEPWRDRETGLIVTRNSLRDAIVRVAPEFLDATVRTTFPGAMFWLDSQATSALVIGSILQSEQHPSWFLWHQTITFGEPSFEDATTIFRRGASRH